MIEAGWKCTSGWLLNVMGNMRIAFAQVPTMIPRDKRLGLQSPTKDSPQAQVWSDLCHKCAWWRLDCAEKHGTIFFCAPSPLLVSVGLADSGSGVKIAL